MEEKKDIQYQDFKDFRTKNKCELFFALILAFITISLCIVFTIEYKKIVSMEISSIECQAGTYQIKDDYPSWFYVSKNTMSTRRPISDSDKIILSSLVSKDDSTYVYFKQDIDKLAYNSWGNEDYIRIVSILLCLLSLIGCFVRSLYDFIGQYCYLQKLRLSIWWPWYFLRPCIVICLSAFLLVLSRGELFNVVSIRSLNSLLIISFFIGFAMQDCIKALRAISKLLIGNLFELAPEKKENR